MESASATMTFMKLMNSPRVPLTESLPVSGGRLLMKAVRCAPFRLGLPPQVEAGIDCEPCKGTGWLLCEFCEGQKTNVKSATNRIYRRCPTCRAIGYVICSKCKVFKCVAFPNDEDGEELIF